MLDTNVLVAGLRSRNGASFLVLSHVGQGRFRTVVSVPLVLEYETALKAHADATGLSGEEVASVLDYLCLVSEHREVYFLWRPVLRDPGDDMVLEVAVGARCDFIVTHDIRDFAGAAAFGVQAITPGQFLKEINTT